MESDRPMTGQDGPGRAHLTTRRGFVTGAGLSILSLYGLWAAYGAAPTSLDFVSSGEGGGPAAMGHGGGSGMSPEQFRRMAEEFVDANRLPDGSVKPRRPRAHAQPPRLAHVAEEAPGHGHAEQHAEAARPGHLDEDAGHGDAEEHGGAPRMAMTDDDGHGGGAGPSHAAGSGSGPIDVYVMATRYGYEPDVLRLDTHVPYRFRIMAVDADHGSSIFMRAAGHMIRCRAKTLTEKTLSFTAPGEYLVYCTVYCGEGHDLMMGKIVVA